MNPFFPRRFKIIDGICAALFIFIYSAARVALTMITGPVKWRLTVRRDSPSTLRTTRNTDHTRYILDNVIRDNIAVLWGGVLGRFSNSNGSTAWIYRVDLVLTLLILSQHLPLVERKCFPLIWGSSTSNQSFGSVLWLTFASATRTFHSCNVSTVAIAFFFFVLQKCGH